MRVYVRAGDAVGEGLICQEIGRIMGKHLPSCNRHFWGSIDTVRHVYKSPIVDGKLSRRCG